MTLFLREWHPGTTPRAGVAIVHGFGEHSGLYADVAKFFVDRDLSACCCDLRGHGNSPGRRGHVDAWSDYHDDVSDMLDAIRDEWSELGLPVFLLGNSMGGLIAADYALLHGDRLAGLILLAPAVGEIGVHPFLLRLSRIFSRVWPTFTLKSGIERSRLSRDPAAIARLDADPLVHSLGTARLGAEVQDAIARVRHAAPRLQLPVLILQGEADQVTSPDSTRRFFESVGAADKTLKTYPGAYHNLVIDTVKGEVMQDIAHWIAELLPTKTRKGESTK